VLSRRVAGVAVAAYAMGMAGVWLLPLALWEVARHGVVLDAGHVSVQALAIVFGGVLPYALWNSALHHWPTSRVMLFNNLIPVSTTVWAFFVLGEPISGTFWVALVMIITGVLVGQADWRKVFQEPEGF
jgi:drug/metabolite transporter (DMT)-like permease